MSRAPAGFETFCPEVPVKTRASTFAVLAFLSFLKWEVFYARTDQIQKRNENGCTW